MTEATTTTESLTGVKDKLVSFGTLRNVCTSCKLDINSLDRESLIFIITMKNGDEKTAFLSKNLTKSWKEGNRPTMGDLQISSSNGGESFVISNAKALLDIEIETSKESKPDAAKLALLKLMGLA